MCRDMTFATKNFVSKMNRRIVFKYRRARHIARKFHDRIAAVSLMFKRVFDILQRETGVQRFTRFVHKEPNTDFVFHNNIDF